MRMLKADRFSYLFSIRATMASLVALWLAFAFKLESPQWAAITVWIVVQPSRGKTLSKGFYRFLGTCVGALAAIFLIIFFDKSPPAFIGLLALWVGLSTSLANLVQYFQSYGFVLAGYTTSIVGLLVFSHPDQILEVAQARIVCIFLGIAVALAMALFLSNSKSKQELFEKVHEIVAETFLWTAKVFLRRPRQELLDGERDLITKISHIEELTNYAALESMQVRRQKRSLHNLLATLFSCISAIRALGLHLRKNPELIAETTESRVEVAETLQSISSEIRTENLSAGFFSNLNSRLYASFAIEEAVGTETNIEKKVLRDRFKNMLASFSTLLEAFQILMGRRKGDPLMTLSFHRDIRHAKIVGLRSSLAVLLAGGIWILTKWSVGPVMVMMTAVNCGIFATSTNPKSGLLIAFKASLISMLAAFLCPQILTIGPATPLFLFFILAVFLIPGGILIPHPSLSLAGILYCADFLVFVSPPSASACF